VSDTPRTAEATFTVRGSTPLREEVVYASFAQSLERENRELLEALKEMFDLFCGGGWMRENWDAAFFKAKDQASAAISRAEGREG